jgi:hypothetical protein
MKITEFAKDSWPPVENWIGATDKERGARANGPLLNVTPVPELITGLRGMPCWRPPSERVLSQSRVIGRKDDDLRRLLVALERWEEHLDACMSPVLVRGLDPPSLAKTKQVLAATG